MRKGAWLVLLTFIFLSISAFAEVPEPPLPADQVTQQRLSEILGQLNSISGKFENIELRMANDLNEMQTFTETKIADSENNIQSVLQHKTDFPTLVISLVMISILNWVFFGMMKAKGAV